MTFPLPPAGTYFVLAEEHLGNQSTAHAGGKTQRCHLT